MLKRVGRKHNWAEKDWAENKSGPKSDLPIEIYICMYYFGVTCVWGIQITGAIAQTTKNINIQKVGFDTELFYSPKHSRR